MLSVALRPPLKKKKSRRDTSIDIEKEQRRKKRSIWKIYELSYEPRMKACEF